MSTTMYVFMEKLEKYQLFLVEKKQTKKDNNKTLSRAIEHGYVSELYIENTSLHIKRETLQQKFIDERGRGIGGGGRATPW